MNTKQIEVVARAAYEANRIYCIAIDDDSQVPWADAPRRRKVNFRSGVRFIVDNPASSVRESRSSWRKHLAGRSAGGRASASPLCYRRVSRDTLRQWVAKDAIFEAVVHGLIAYFSGPSNA